MVELTAASQFGGLLAGLPDYVLHTTGSEGRFLVFRTDKVVGGALYHDGLHAAYEVTLARTVLRPGEAAMDIGAHVGTLAIPMANAVGPDGQVIAVEMQPVLADLLWRNARLNHHTNLRIHNAACGAKPGQTSIGPINYAKDYNFGGIGIEMDIPHPTRSSEQTTPIDIVTIDALHPGTPVRYIKIDVEGGEDAVLKGATQTLTTDRPILSIEVSSDAEIEAFITKLTPLYDRFDVLFSPSRADADRHGALTVTCNLIVGLDMPVDLPDRNFGPYKSGAFSAHLPQGLK